MDFCRFGGGLILPENVPPRSLQAVLSNGFAFCLMWNVLENGYLEPHANTRIDFHRERGKVRHEVVNLLNSSQIILIRILKI